MITKIIQKIQNRLKKEFFFTSYLSVIINPAHIIRNGLFQNISKYAPMIEGSILDLGCGSKPYESLFKNCSKYTGVDIEVSGPNHEVEKFGKNSKVDYFYDGKTLPFKDNSFDAVISFEVFEHIFNIDEITKEIKRVLKPGGKLLVSMPFAWNEHEQPYDFARYTSFGIKHILNKQNFEIKKIEKTTTYFLAIMQTLIAYLSNHVLPKGKILRKISQIVLIFPLNLFSILLNKILPKRYEYFCNTLVYATKIN